MTTTGLASEDFAWARLRERARRLRIEPRLPVGLDDAATDFSDRLPNQLGTYHPHNWTGPGDSGHDGEWLRSLKATKQGDRQFIWCDDAIRGIVTFAGWVRDGGGFYEGWGGISRLRRPVSREMLLNHPRTRARFDATGIHAVQGLPIRVLPELALPIVELAGGIRATEVPLDEPDYSEEPILWAGPHGLAPESYIEASVAATPRLWRELGFQTAPRRQVRLGTAGRVDLIAGGVVGEAKRSVTLRNGPAQIERYLEHLRLRRRRGQPALKGVLLQCAEDASPAVIDRIRNSSYSLELWAVLDDNGRWVLDCLA